PRSGRAGLPEGRVDSRGPCTPKSEVAMRSVIGWAGVSAVATLLVLGTTARADDKKVPPEKVPKAVMDAVKARFPGAEITSVEKETMDGKVIYDIELKQQGRKYEMDIQEDGTVLEVEKEVAGKDVPEVVTKAVLAKYPGATIKEVMEVNKVKDKQETP